MTETRATSKKHAEYAILKHLLTNHDLSTLRAQMIDDGVSDKRFNQGGEAVLKIIQGLVDRRKHTIPKDHPDYQAKEASE